MGCISPHTNLIWLLDDGLVIGGLWGRGKVEGWKVSGVVHVVQTLCSAGRCDWVHLGAICSDLLGLRLLGMRGVLYLLLWLLLFL